MLRHAGAATLSTTVHILNTTYNSLINLVSWFLRASNEHKVDALMSEADVMEAGQQGAYIDFST